MHPDDQLDALLDSWQEAVARGVHPTPAELCRDWPELLPEVRRRWQEFQHIDAQVRTCLPGLATGPYTGAAAPSADGLPHVPGYEVEARLGRGGMGVVYRARQVGLNRIVALKMVLGGAFVAGKSLARFRAEAQAVARLQHPNIVQIFETGDVDGLPYFSQEYVEGGTLARHLDGFHRRPLS